MDFEAVRARLNLLAVLPNLEDVVRYDPEMAELVKGSRVTIQFSVAGGLKAFVRLADGACTVGRGSAKAASVDGSRTGADGSRTGAEVVLWFASAAHLNRMFDGKAQPIPLRGFRHLGFLKKEFTRLTDRMAYFLKPTPGLLADPGYLAMNTRLTLNTAVYAVPVLLAHDPEVSRFRGMFTSGSIALRVLPDGPNVGLALGPDEIRPIKGDIEKPTALIALGSLEIANAFLNGSMDTFAAVAKGDVAVWGQLPKVDTLALVLDRLAKYLS
jgi:hypothetical protein